MSIIRDAISRSRHNDEIVRVRDWTDQERAELAAAADGSADGNGVTEYWADDKATPDGMLWRVHLLDREAE